MFPINFHSCELICLIDRSCWVHPWMRSLAAVRARSISECFGFDWLIKNGLCFDEDLCFWIDYSYYYHYHFSLLLNWLSYSASESSNINNYWFWSVSSQFSLTSSFPFLFFLSLFLPCFLSFFLFGCHKDELSLITCYTIVSGIIASIIIIIIVIIIIIIIASENLVRW